MSQVDVIERNMDGKNLQIGIVVSRFNEYAGKELYAACLEELKRLGVKEKHITKVTVPGALETPLVLSKLAGTGEYDASLRWVPSSRAKPTTSNLWLRNRRAGFLGWLWNTAFRLPTVF